MQGEPVVLHGVLLLAILALSVLAMFPVFRKRVWINFLPLFSVVLYALYEMTMPSHINIRVDLLVLYPLLLLCVLSPVIKLGYIIYKIRNGSW